MIRIRTARNEDIDGVFALLEQVLEIHAEIRPDIFKTGSTKYTREQLETFFADANTPVFVALINDEVVGHLFCRIETYPLIKTLYIDDLCVDEKRRGNGVGKGLFAYAVEYAKSVGCYNVTLNVWEGNDGAKAF